jgi:hypothetical protein
MARPNWSIALPVARLKRIVLHVYAALFVGWLLLAVRHEILACDSVGSALALLGAVVMIGYAVTKF